MHDVDRLFRTYHAMLVRYLTRRLGDRDWAEEVAQETFVRALRQETIDQRAGVALHGGQQPRARRGAKGRAGAGASELLARGERERWSSRSPRARARAGCGVGAAAVDALAERDRLALLMREEGLDYTEIAAALGLSVGSIGTTLSRARRRLVEAYEALQRGAAAGGRSCSILTKERSTPGSTARFQPTGARRGGGARRASARSARRAVAEARGLIAASSRILDGAR